MWTNQLHIRFCYLIFWFYGDNLGIYSQTKLADAFIIKLNQSNDGATLLSHGERKRFLQTPLCQCQPGEKRKEQKKGLQIHPNPSWNLFWWYKSNDLSQTQSSWRHHSAVFVVNSSALYSWATIVRRIEATTGREKQTVGRLLMGLGHCLSHVYHTQHQPIVLPAATSHHSAFSARRSAPRRQKSTFTHACWRTARDSGFTCYFCESVYICTDLRFGDRAHALQTGTPSPRVAPIFKLGSPDLNRSLMRHGGEY